jgi:tripartite-type tricarboxylate transporter receptor subunit TctC
MKHLRNCGVAASFLGALMTQGPVSAQSLEQFYRGKTIDMIIGYPPGGSNDIYARLVAKHIGKYIPGNPSVVIRNMPGAGSIVAGNYLYNLAPKDGTVLGLVSPTMPLDEKLGAQGVKFESAKFNWIGRVAPSVNICFYWSASPIKTTEDLFTKPSTSGATGAGSTVSVYPNVMNNVLGSKIKLVMGYAGSPEAMLAMERGEVDGHSTSFDALRTSHPEWIAQGKVRILVQFALTRHPQLPDVPTLVELARTDEQRQILRAVMNATEIGKMILSPPGQPPERVAALRHAFDQVMQDPEFAADVEISRVERIPLSGEALQKLVEEVGNLTPEIAAKVKAVYGQGG